MKKHLNTKEAADYLGLSPRTLQQWRYEKKPPEYKRISHKLVLYSVDDLENFINKRGSK